MSDKPAILTARDAPAIIEAVVREMELDCPDDAMPSEATLAAWLMEFPEEGEGAASSRLAALYGGSGWSWVALDDGEGNSPVLVAISRTTSNALKLRGPSLATIHADWCEKPDADRPRHPLAPLIGSWYGRPPETEADTQDTAIMGQSLFAWTAGRAPAVLQGPLHDNELPIRPGLVDAERGEMLLAGVMPQQKDSAVVPAPALVVAEEIGFGDVSPGRGARIDKRLLAHALLSLPQSERRPGGRYTLRVPLRRIAHEWIWPAPAETGTGRGTRGEWKPSRHARLLARSMNAVTLAGVILPDGREWRPGMFRTRPRFDDLDSEAVIEIALPAAAEHGPMIRRDALIAAGVVSDPAFDGALTLATLWDRAKAANGGFRIYATRPMALRNGQGHLTRADGTVILGHGRNPLRGHDLRLRWLPGDVPQRDWRHPEAVLVGHERHPQADRVPLLDRDDRRRLFYGRRSDGQERRVRSKAANRADARLRQLEAEGRVVIEDCGADGWRVLEPWPGTTET
ncbi:MAG: hypothetical protein OXE86_09525 [Alphaproteobacteria bacterium]|nr:hypothetical protein [Alphaproteobacteria bacterium]